MSETSTESGLGRKSDPTLRDLLAPLFRRKRAVFFTFCGILLGTGLTAYLLSSRHRATMEILVSPERVDAVVTPESTQVAAAAPPISDSKVNSEIELLKSPDLLEQVVIANKLQEVERKSLFSRIVYGKQDDKWYVARAIDDLTDDLKVKLVTKTSMIQVSYGSANPQRAYKVLNVMANRYLEKHLAVHRPPGTYDFFSSQAQKYQQALQDSEARLAEFSKTAGDAAPELQKAAMAQQVVSFVAALHETHQKIAAEKQRIQDQEMRLKATPDRSLSQQSSDSAQSLLQKLQADLLEHEIKRSELTLKYDPSYPLVKEADKEIDKIKAAITEAGKLQYVNQTTDRDPSYELIREDIVKTRADLVSHQASGAALENSIRDLQRQMVDFDQKALQQADLSREVKTNESNYLLYASKREQARTSDALDQNRIANVSIAVPPVLPILPLINPVLVILIGIALAVFVSAGTAFVAEYLNPSLRTPNEVIEVLRIPVLASVPKQSA
jgi:uncharacterized protein involved in exopolysaccharide biosynthesis